MTHIKLKCTDPQCTGDCNTCQLFTCSVCKCSEGELPTDCPGHPVDPAIRERIYAGSTDFKDGHWYLVVDDVSSLAGVHCTGHIDYDRD
jgi:hypothetical protein